VRAAAVSCAVAASVVLAAGCGGSGDRSDDPDAVTRAVTDYAHAFGSGDGGKACGLLTPGARDSFVKRVSSLVGTSDCAEAISKLQSVAGPNVTGPFQDATVSGARVTGDKASAELKAGGAAKTVSLERRDGKWLLTRVPGT
jgi:hypothetical protein